jgi:hypothetical protein
MSVYRRVKQLQRLFRYFRLGSVDARLNFNCRRYWGD